jgi:glutamate/aspartate transport system substrate-binding protein
LLAGLIANSKSPADFRIAGETLSVEPIAIMFRKDDPNFKKAVDGAIIGMMKNGEFAKLYAKWFQGPIPPRNANLNLPMSDTLKDLVANPNDRPAEAYRK